MFRPFTVWMNYYFANTYYVFSNLQKFPQSMEQFFLKASQYNFWNKILLLVVANSKTFFHPSLYLKAKTVLALFNALFSCVLSPIKVLRGGTECFYSDGISKKVFLTFDNFLIYLPDKGIAKIHKQTNHLTQ